MIVKDECGAGHESAGEIVAVGPGVSHLKVGDKVAIEAGVPCSRPDCSACAIGRYNACKCLVFVFLRNVTRFPLTSSIPLFLQVPTSSFFQPLLTMARFHGTTFTRLLGLTSCQTMCRMKRAVCVNRWR